MNSEKAKILLLANNALLGRLLSYPFEADYEIYQAASAVEAASLLRDLTDKPHLMLADISKSETDSPEDLGKSESFDGFKLFEFMKSEDSLQNIPVIFISDIDLQRKCLSLGAADCLSKPFELDILKMRVDFFINMSLKNASLEALALERANDLIRTKNLFLETLLNLVENKNLEPSKHVGRTKKLAQILIDHLIKTKRYQDELSNINQELLTEAMLLHDMGKIGVPENILLKPGKLTKDEFKIIEQHTLLGAQIIDSLRSQSSSKQDFSPINALNQDEYLKYSSEICRSHHERWDGKGYPDKLSGKDIPITARIAAVIDIYDALVSERCYKRSYSHEESLAILQESSGNHLDPEIVAAFLEVSEQVLKEA